jgi:glycosyltransferase involved in cell wall biosynthesis
MDDCSPDDPSSILGSFMDQRLKYIRNRENLGHLANYNKGISISRGKYVWLISADDRLRCPYVLERYVRLMDQHPTVGYACCPGIGLHDGVETNVVPCGYFGPRDKIFDGRQFIAVSLRNGYGPLAPSVMVRRDCYEQIGTFPLDMPHQGDMYLWFRWALEYDVAYICQPMVNYRYHDLNIMKDLIRRVPDAVFRDEMTVLWRTKRHCQQKGLHTLAARCEQTLTARYARSVASTIYSDIHSHLGMSVAECDRALRIGSSCILEQRRLRAQFFAYLANQHWRHGAFDLALRTYGVALRENWRTPHLWLKVLVLLAGLGRAGPFFRRFRREGDYRLFIGDGCDV